MSTSDIRACGAQDEADMVEIINAAAQRYQGVIPDDCWHEPYMPAAELRQEIEAGVSFIGLAGDRLTSVMGVQPVKDVHLIRHAYVLPACQGQGQGSRLLRRLLDDTTGPILVGTWAAATWAIAFYRKHGFELASPQATPDLLRTYWNVPPRQIETSVVLTLRH